MAKIDLKARQTQLEEEGRFAVDMNEQHRTFDARDIEDGYNYLPVRITERIRRLWLLCLVKAVGPLLTAIAAGTRVKGRKNLRPLKGRGAISVCSHTHMLDTLMVKQALGVFRTFHTGSYYLLKRGFLGRLFKAGGFIPVSMKIRDIKNLQDAVGRLVDAGKIVNFYPEHALWPRYEKVRPFQAGAFRYAVKFGVPVVPLFIEYRQTPLRRFFRMKKKAIVHILPALYPPEEGTEHERAAALSDAVYAAMKDAYERAYGKKMLYDTDLRYASRLPASARSALRQGGGEESGPTAVASAPQSFPADEKGRGKVFPPAEDSVPASAAPDGEELLAAENAE